METKEKRPLSATPNTPKDNHFQSQMKTVYKAFRQPKTMLQVAIETGILRANICRYIAYWRECNKIERTKTGVCPVSKHTAGFYQTQ